MNTGNDSESPLRSVVRLLCHRRPAETLHGSARVTYDTDLCYRKTEENLKRLAPALREMKVTLRNAPKDLPFQIDHRALALGDNFTFDTPYDDVDLLGYVEPIGTYEELIRNAEEYPVGGYMIKVISLDDLIRIRKHLGRSKDLESLLHLEAIKQVRAERGEA